MLTPILSGKLADRYSDRVPISAGFLVISGGILVFLLADGYPAFILSWVLSGAGVGLLSPAYQSLVSKVVPSSSLGAFNGVFYSSVGFLVLPAPWIGVQLWERYDPRLPFFITMVVCALTVIPTWLKFKLPDKPAAPTAEEAA